MLASARDESGSGSNKEILSESQGNDAATVEEDWSRKGSVSTILSFIDSREDPPSEFGCTCCFSTLLTLRRPDESPGYSTTSCRSTSPSVLFSPRQTHVQNSSISSVAPSSHTTTTAASPIMFSPSYGVKSPPAVSQAPPTKAQQKSPGTIELEDGLARSQKDWGLREEPALIDPRFVFPGRRPLDSSVNLVFMKMCGL